MVTARGKLQFSASPDEGDINSQLCPGEKGMLGVEGCEKGLS